MTSVLPRDRPSGPPSPSTGAGPSPVDRPAILWLVVALNLCALYSLTEFRAVVWSLTLPDTDDAMRLVEIRNLLAGQGWFDLVEHRLTPPAGVSMHWSRLVDAPIAALIGLATPLVGRPLAEGLVAALWPPTLFAIYLTMVHRAVGVRFGPRPAVLSVLVATWTAGLTGLFSLGRIDHHGIQVLLLLGTALAIAGPGRSPGKAALAGMCAALSLAVGLEALPFIVLAGLVLLCDWIRDGEPARADLAGFALALAAASMLLFAVQTDPQLWLTTRCDALSPPWLGMACAAAAMAAGAGAARRYWGAPGRAGPLRRAGFAGLCGAAAIAGFALLFPACLSGPFQDLPPIVRTAWLDRVLEMQPFRAFLALQPADALAYVAPLLLAGLVAGLAARTGPPAHRRAALIAALFLLTGFVLAQFQIRAIYVASGFVAPVAGPALDQAITRLRRDEPLWRRLAAVALAALLIGQVWTILAGTVLAVLAAPATASRGLTPPWLTCIAKADLTSLNAIEAGPILAHPDFGPSILLHTHHSVVAAPYHRAIAGLTAAAEALDGDRDTLKRVLAASGATYLALCDRTGQGEPGGAVPFVTDLAGGKAAVPWLERLPLGTAPVSVWRVRRPE